VTLARCFGPCVAGEAQTLGVVEGGEEEAEAITKFVGAMNRAAHALGCVNTSFRSVHGMTDDNNLRYANSSRSLLLA
jgi:hypothetical protein